MAAWLQAVRGVIFASGLKRDVFTAGNDIKELYAPQTSRSRRVCSLHSQLLLPAATDGFPRAHLQPCTAATPTGEGNDVFWGNVMGRYREFWVTSNVFLARLHRTPLVTVAAIKGACPAGGCCLSMCCDLRIMTQQARCPPPDSGVMSSLLAGALSLLPERLCACMHAENARRAAFVVACRATSG